MPGLLQVLQVEKWGRENQRGYLYYPTRPTSVGCCFFTAWLDFHIHSDFFLRFPWNFPWPRSPHLCYKRSDPWCHMSGSSRKDLLVKEKVHTWSLGQTPKNTSHSCLGSQVPSRESIISRLGKIFLTSKVLQCCKVGKTWDLKSEDLGCESQLHGLVKSMARVTVFLTHRNEVSNTYVTKVLQGLNKIKILL